MDFTTVYQVLDLSFNKLKYSCNVKDIECLKCIICFEYFILQQSHSDGMLASAEYLDCTWPRTNKHHNLLRRHSSANFPMHDM